MKTIEYTEDANSEDEKKKDKDEDQEFIDEDIFLAFLSQMNLNESKGKKTIVNFTAYDFKDLLIGRKAGRLIKMLSDQPLCSPIFELEPIQAYLESQWQFFKKYYYFIAALYFACFFLQLLYYEYTFEMRKYDRFSDWKEAVSDNPNLQEGIINKKLVVTFLVYGFLFAFVFSLFIFEIKRY